MLLCAAVWVDDHISETLEGCDLLQGGVYFVGLIVIAVLLDARECPRSPPRLFLRDNLYYEGSRLLCTLLCVLFTVKAVYLIGMGTGSRYYLFTRQGKGLSSYHQRIRSSQSVSATLTGGSCCTRNQRDKLSAPNYAYAPIRGITPRQPCQEDVIPMLTGYPYQAHK
ncbi:unnamed protein product [Peronospora belbahrii]|uniref:Uncharacterized protein n=1 Tax=Peronospora belbahrii TaxID=622444 RepID=A0AAU9L3H1_9STRA|nr:unnamed protein product [Peronospora belbahrii]